VLRHRPTLKCEPTWRPKKAAAVGVATISSTRDGSAARPAVMVTRSCRENSPSSLAISSTWARSTLLRPPLGVSVAAPYELAQLTRLTWGSRAIWEMKPEVHASVSFGCTNRSEGFVPARNVGYEDSVRRAPAIEAMATPPTSPMRRAMAR
jgi:hypothetical protein